MIKPIKIGGQNVVVVLAISILSALKLLGHYCSRFCFHETLNIAGNCRACLLELEGFEKPLPACVADLELGQIIWTESLFSQKCKQNVFEGLLVNHPLDCPICDQAGECDLQDQAKVFGGDRSRFFFNKRGVLDKNCDFLVKAIMVRCIHCTRCIRFNNTLETSRLGILLRGSASSIGNYFYKAVNSNLFGNVVDLCPVGALTSRIQAFSARPWELKIFDGIDLLDGFGANVYFHIKESLLVKILPKPNKNLNGFIINDNCRFFIFNKSFATELWIFKRKLTWFSFFKQFEKVVNSNNHKIKFLINETLNFSQISFLKNLCNKFCNNTQLVLLQKLSTQNFEKYNSNSLSLIKTSVVVFLATNLKLESAILHFKLSIKHKKTLLSLFCLGLGFNQNLNINFCGLTSKHALGLFEGKTQLTTQLNKNLNIVLLSGRSFNLNPTYFKYFTSKIFTAQLLKVSIFCNERGVSFLGIKRACKALHRSNHNIVFFFCLNQKNSIPLRKVIKKHFICWFSPIKRPNFKIYSLIPTASAFTETGVYLSQQKLQLARKVVNNNFKQKNILTILAAIFQFTNKKNKNLKLFFNQIKNFNNVNGLFLEDTKKKIKIMVLEKKTGWEIEGH